MSSKYFDVKHHTIASQHIREYPRATIDNQEEILRLAVKQYTPLSNPNPSAGDVTIIGAHANGFPKELYEPLWDDLLSFSQKNGFQIRGIWIMDISHQGASGILNEHEIGLDPSWNDGTRDMLHMINTFRTEIRRPIIGMGHSLGGCQLINLALFHARLLTTLILFEPMIQEGMFFYQSKKLNPAVRASAFRKDFWPSRDAARVSFMKNKFYQIWDPRVFDLWMEYGLRDVPTVAYPENSTSTQEARPVTLTCTKAQEVASYLRMNLPSTYKDTERRTVDRALHPDMQPEFVEYPGYRPEPSITYRNLPLLRPSALVIFGGNITTQYPGYYAKMVVERFGTGVGGSGGIENGRVNMVVFEGNGHLVPMEAVSRSAETAAGWIGKEMEVWRAEEQRFDDEWKGKTFKEKTSLSDEWIGIFTEQGWKATLDRMSSREKSRL